MPLAQSKHRPKKDQQANIYDSFEPGGHATNQGSNVVKKDIEKIKKKILPILKQHGAKKVGLFGSYVRGEPRRGSDIDILVEIENDISLLDFVGLKLKIEEVLGKKIDLVEYNTIKPLLRERILKEQVVIL